MVSSEKRESREDESRAYFMMMSHRSTRADLYASIKSSFFIVFFFPSMNYKYGTSKSCRTSLKKSAYDVQGKERQPSPGLIQE